VPVLELTRCCLRLSCSCRLQNGVRRAHMEVWRYALRCIVCVPVVLLHALKFCWRDDAAPPSQARLGREVTREDIEVSMQVRARSLCSCTLANARPSSADAGRVIVSRRTADPVC
jgi:hypothetical protein